MSPPPSAETVTRNAQDRRLAVFCDFDGTFSVQDVGASIADAHRGAERPTALERLFRGEITAWQATCSMLDGLELPASELEAFLRTIELDPGARTLLAWCRDRDVPFEILSDGFDYNLERLQEIHGVAFAFRANRLRYQGDVWSIEPGAPDPNCQCGTGTCKRGIIERHRSAHPTSFCVHIGNGRISDLCGAIAADLAFAKDSLAPALEERGVEYVPFETLYDVVAQLDALPVSHQAIGLDTARPGRALI